MKTLTNKQLEEIAALDQKGDKLLAKRKFDATLDALDAYIRARELLVKYADDSNAKNGMNALRTEVPDYAVMYNELTRKADIAMKQLADRKVC